MEQFKCPPIVPARYPVYKPGTRYPVCGFSVQCMIQLWWEPTGPEIQVWMQKEHYSYSL